MKKAIILLLSFVLIAGMAGFAGATPIFNANTYADFGVGENPDDSIGAGYYIWTNDADRTSWSVRWTGRELDNSFGWYQWAGGISYSNNNGIVSTDLVAWEPGDGGLTVVDIFGSDIILYGLANAGPAWDGFDFTLTGEIGDYLTFNLASSYFTVDNDGIYIGQDMVSVIDNCNNSQYFIGATGAGRQFEAAAPAPVPEPATMLLLGTGLAGMAAVRRRKGKKA